MGLPVRPGTQAEAAQLVGSNPVYIAAATTVIKADTPDLIDSIVCRQIPLLEAAESVRKRVQLVQAYREADQNDRKALGKIVGVDHLFDEAIAPLL
jgi:hypothetical protein